MARIRTVKPTHWADRELPNISLGAHLFWLGTWNFSDDKGVFEYDPILLRSQVFPRRVDITNEDISKFCKELEAYKFIVLFNYKGIDYYVSRTFEDHQRIDKPQKSKVPDEVILNSIQSHSKIDLISISPVLYSKGKDSNRKVKITAKAVGTETVPPTLLDESLKNKFEEAKKTKKGLVEFIKAEKPKDIEPYFLLWNVFAEKYKVPTVSKITASRKRKFNVRMNESGFDMVKILEKAAGSEFLRTGSWFGFDWIIENDKNWLKVIEGNYDKNFTPATKKTAGEKTTNNQSNWKTELEYLYGRFDEGELDLNLITANHYDSLITHNMIPLNTLKNYKADSIDEQKQLAVVDYFKKMKADITTKIQK